MKKPNQQSKGFYNKVNSKTRWKFNGWDFSKIKCISEGVTFELYEEVIKQSHKGDFLLDIGTGGGEKIIKISKNFQTVIGIDISKSMINIANKNLSDTTTKNTKFFIMDSKKIQFPDNFFNTISCRHAPFNAMENFRLLNKGGLFITQQVGEGDKFNIKQFFKRGQHYKKKDGTMMQNYIKQLKNAGFTNIKTLKYDATEYYKTPDDLIFLLEHTPIINDFGKKSSDYRLIDDFIKQNITSKGIKTNSKRYLIIAEK